MDPQAQGGAPVGAPMGGDQPVYQPQTIQQPGLAARAPAQMQPEQMAAAPVQQPYVAPQQQYVPPPPGPPARAAPVKKAESGMTVASVIGSLRAVPALNPVADKLEIWYENDKVQAAIGAIFKEDFLQMCARFMVSLYFLNVWLTAIQTWYWYGQPFPKIKVFLIVPAVGLILNIQPKFIAIVCMLDIVVDNFYLLSGVAMQYYYRHVLYVNELMVKKLSLLGAVSLILFSAFSKEASTFTSTLTAKDAAFSTAQNIALLLARLLLCALFVWAGQGEIRRQIAAVHSDGHGHMVHDRPPGDGHDQIWAKLGDFLFAIPICAGWKTKESAYLLAFMCVLEAWLQWSGFFSWGGGVFIDWGNLGPFYQMHAREHFVVNLSAAGGLMLLSSIGAGKYSVDEYMKKHD
jgi:uncharacterized membrane protein YphA (DoxX/SURF4 family)